jgi:hypothetical protein
MLTYARMACPEPPIFFKAALQVLLRLRSRLLFLRLRSMHRLFFCRSDPTLGPYERAGRLYVYVYVYSTVIHYAAADP